MYLFDNEIRSFWWELHAKPYNPKIKLLGLGLFVGHESNLEQPNRGCGEQLITPGTKPPTSEFGIF